METQFQHGESRLIRERRGVWTFEVRGEALGTIVRVVEAQELRDRTNLLVETNTGDRIWVRGETVRLLDLSPDLAASI